MLPADVQHTANEAFIAGARSPTATAAAPAPATASPATKIELSATGKYSDVVTIATKGEEGNTDGVIDDIDEGEPEEASDSVGQADSIAAQHELREDEANNNDLDGTS